MPEDIKQRIIFDDSQLIQSLTDQYKLVTKVSEALKETETAYKGLGDVATKQIDSTNEVIKEGAQVIGKHTSETIKAKNESKGWSASLKGLADEVNVLGVNLGGTIDKLRAKSQAMKGAVQGINAGTNAMKIFKIALASTGIGLLIVALGSVVAFFKKTEAGAEKLEQVMAGVGAVINVLTDRVAKLGGAIVKFFSGDFSGAAKDAKAAVSGINDELIKEIGLMVTLKKREQELEDARRGNRKANAENIVELKKQQLIADDNTKSTKERIEAAKKAGEIERKNLEENLKLAQEDLDIEKAKFDAGAKLDEDADKVIDKEVALAELKSESLTRQKKLQGQLQGIQAEQLAKDQERIEKITAINKLLNDQVNKIADALQKVKLDKLSPEERIQAEAEIAKGIIDEQFKLLDEYAKAANREVDMTKEKAALILAVEENMAKQIKAIRDGSLKEVAKLEDLGQIKSRERQEGVLDDMMKIAPKQAEVLKAPWQELQDKVAVALDLTREELKGILSGMDDVLSAAFNAMGAANERAIEKNDAILDGIRERQDLLTDDIEKERERDALGLANSLDAKSKEREALKKEEEAALKEQEKLRKKQLAQQLLQDAIQQGSSIASMVANVLASPSTSLLGPAGIPIALATIAGFLGILAKIKSSQKKLYQGGSLQQDGVTGFVNKNGRTDRNGGRGHQVEDSNLVLGGKEFVVNEKTAMTHAAFLEALNRGEFDAGDGLHFAMGHNKELEHGSAIVSAMNERRNHHGVASAMASMIKLSLDSSMGKLIAVIKDKPDTVAYTPGQILRKEKDGKVTITQTEPDWKWKPEARG